MIHPSITRAILAAAACFLSVPAVAQPATPARAAAAAPTLQSRLDQLVKLLNRSGEYAELFAPVFREQVPQAKFEAIANQLRSQGGAATGIASITPVDQWHGKATIAYEKMIVSVQIALDPAGTHQITGLLITGAEPRDDSMAKLKADFQKLHGQAGFGIYRLSEKGIAPVAEVNGEIPAPLGSAFKLWILAEASREVSAHQRRWTDVLHVGQPSLPSGILQSWPAHAPVTLQTLATLMISISDNTASDTLLTTLGRAKVDAMVRTTGVRDPDRTLPVLTTKEAFQLKTPAHKALADDWASDTPAAREKLLAANAADFAATKIDPALFAGGPMRIETVEWFASPSDMARTLNWLRVHGDATTRAILAVNHGTDASTAGRFAYVGYKGGSEPGVITLNYLVKTKSGDWFAVTGNWHDADAAVSDEQFALMMARALDLASG